MTTVNVNGVTYNIPSEKLNELIMWLESNKISTVMDNVNPEEYGKTIING